MGRERLDFDAYLPADDQPDVAGEGVMLVHKAGAALGTLWQRVRDARRRSKGLYTRRPAASRELTFASWLVISKIDDPKDGGPAGPDAHLIILQRPDPRK
jgi:hypothetical protein